MKALSRNEEIIRQVKLAKKSQFGVTGVKVELEARFGRANWRFTGTVECANCDGGNKQHNTCGGNGCDNCDYNGSRPCKNCYFKRENWRDNFWCQQWLLKELHKYGLSTKRRRTGMYEAKKPLVFAKFYTDPSVDSEFTFTISLDKPENIFLLPKIVEVWKEIGRRIGNPIDVSNAGMHMALLQDKNCYYPVRNETADDRIRLQNFSKSMSLLMPALFFLGSADSRSRKMYFRRPQVSAEKYSAIHYYGRALEFRVFETCYDNPEQILDNFVVMRNCIRFWSKNYRSPKLEKITRSFKFGNDVGERVDRLYTTTTHLDLLSAGLIKIKPAYKTLKQLKAEREFKVSKRDINKRLNKARKDAELAYAEYSSRFSWRTEAGKVRVKWSVLERMSNPTPEQRESLRRESELEAIRWAEEEESTKETQESYVQKEVDRYITRNSGDYGLAV